MNRLIRQYADDGRGFVHGGSGPLTVYGDKFKSVKDIPPANFLEQFGKDLKNTEVSDLSQINWIFDGKKVTQEHLTNAIKKAIDDWTVPNDIREKWIKGNITERDWKNDLIDIFKAE